MLTQDELKCVRVYSYLQRQLAPKRQEQKRSNWIERRMEKLENKTANKKQLKEKRDRRVVSSDGGGKKEEREWIKEKRRR